MPILWALVIEVPLYIKVKTFTQWKRKQIDRYYYEQNIAGEVSLSDHMSNFYYKLNWITTGLICSIQISHFLSFTFTLYPEYTKEEIINNFPFPFFHIYSLSWIHKKRNNKYFVVSLYHVLFHLSHIKLSSLISTTLLKRKRRKKYKMQY